MNTTHCLVFTDTLVLIAGRMCAIVTRASMEQTALLQLWEDLTVPVLMATVDTDVRWTPASQTSV